MNSTNSTNAWSSWLVLGLWIIFVVVSVGLRSFVLWRRTGRTGFGGLRRSGSAAEKVAGAHFGVAFLAGLGNPIAVLTGLLAPWRPTAWPVMAVTGAVLALVGVLATIVAQFAMGDSWRVGVNPDERAELVTGGPFALARNPIFSSMLLAAAGLALMLPTALAAASWITLLAAVHIQVRAVEEPHLRTVHGQRYADYAARVGRFLPSFRRSAAVHRSNGADSENLTDGISRRMTSP